VPAFYAKVEPPQLEPARIRARVKTPIWVAPTIEYRASARPVWIAAPSADWRAKVKIQPAPMRAKVGWYVRPPSLKAKVLVGTNVTGAWDSKLAVAAPSPRASLRGAWTVPVGMKIKLGAPDLSAAASARAKFKVGVPAVDARAGADVRGKVGVKVPDADVRGKVNVKVPDVRPPDAKAELKAKVGVKVPAIEPPDVKAKIGVGAGIKAGAGAQVRDHRDAAAGAGAGASAGAKATVKVKAPEVKVKAPTVKVKGEAKGGFKIGN
jgi:hypothetical protein